MPTVWNGTDGSSRDTYTQNWTQGEEACYYEEGAPTIFEDKGAGTVYINEEIKPGFVLVKNSEGYDYTWEGSGYGLSGEMSLTKRGAGTLTLCGAKLSTIKVSNSLTLEGGTTLNFGFNVTEKDVAKGKAYKVFTFKTIDDSITDDALNELLGLGTDAATLDFDTKRKAITLTVTDAAAWNAYAESVRTGELVAVASEDDVLVESAGGSGVGRARRC